MKKNRYNNYNHRYAPNNAFMIAQSQIEWSWAIMLERNAFFDTM